MGTGARIPVRHLPADRLRNHVAGRDMKTSHRGMGISESDWQTFRGQLEATLDSFEVPSQNGA